MPRDLRSVTKCIVGLLCGISPKEKFRAKTRLTYDQDLRVVSALRSFLGRCRAPAAKRQITSVTPAAPELGQEHNL